MKKSDLLSALEKVKMPLKESNLVQFSGLLIFDNDLLTSYGDKISVSVLLDSGIKAAIKYEEFDKLIRKIKDEFVELDVDDKQLIVKYGKNSQAGFSLIAYDHDKIPDMGISKIEQMNTVPKDFAAGLGFCCFSAGGDSGIQILDYVKVESERIISTDKFRITVFNNSEKIDLSEPILVPRKIASFLSSFNITAIVSDGACAHYQDEQETIFTHRLISSSDYPDVDQFLEVEGVEIEFPIELAGALEQAQIGAKEEDVWIKIAKEGIEVSGSNENCWVVSKIDYKHKGKKIEFKSDPQYLLQILSKSNRTVINENVLLFKGENFSHFISLLE